MSESQSNELPDQGDYVRAKRDLIRKGLRAGHLTIKDIKVALPPQHVSGAELELLIFSLTALGVKVTGGDRRPTARKRKKARTK